MPMGFLVDKKGKRLALVLNITSTILYWSWIALVGTYLPPYSSAPSLHTGNL
jgi:hypothetical protein